MNFSLLCHANQLPLAPWEKLSQGATLFSAADWLQMREGELPEHGRPGYILASAESGELMGAATGYAFESSPHPLYDPAVLLAGAIQPDILSDLSASPVVIGAGWSEFRGEFLLSSDPEDSAGRSMIKSLARRMVDWADDCRASYVAFYYIPLDTAHALVEEFGTRQATIVFHDIEAMVEPRWSSFDEYLWNLKRKRRRSVRRELRSFEESGRRIRELRLEPAIPYISCLNSAHMNRHGHTYTPQRSRAVFERQAALLNHRSSVLLAEDDTGPTGFALRYLHAGNIYTRTVGFDYTRSNAFDYFVLYYEAVRRMIEEKSGSIFLGQASMEVKLSRGGTPHPLYNVLLTPGSSRGAMSTRAQRVSADRVTVLFNRFGASYFAGIRPANWLPDV